MADDVTKQISALDKKFDEQFKAVRREIGGVRQEAGSVRQEARQEFGSIRQEIGSIRQEGRGTRVLLEDVQHRVQALGEGLTGMTGRIDRMERSLTTEIRATQATYTPLTVHTALDRRVGTLEKARRKN